MDIIQKIETAEKNLHNEFVTLSKNIWNHPELGYQEYYASQLLADYLIGKGFAVEKPYAGF